MELCLGKIVIYRTFFKNPIGMSPYGIVFGKNCHLPMKLEYRDFWALKLLRFDYELARKNMLMQLNELDKLGLTAY